MATINNVTKSPIQGKTGTLNRSSGYEYRDFWYTDASGKKIHVVGWHKAVDITTLGTIVAFERGKVISVTKGIKGQTTNPSTGNQVTLEHANGDRTTYFHLDNGSNDHIKVGDIVEAGAKLGTDTIKTTGNSTGRHLHFGIYIKSKGDYVDPTPYLQGKSKLTPYGGGNVTSTLKFKVGDKVIINGALHGSSDGTKPGKTVKNVKTKVTRAISGKKCPYNTTGNLGWVSESSLKLQETATTSQNSQTVTSTKLKFKVGDKVVVNGVLYGSSDGTKPGKTVKNVKTKVTRAISGKKCPYNTTGDLGWVSESSLKLQ